jgi:hypothetical protein
MTFDLDLSQSELIEDLKKNRAKTYLLVKLEMKLLIVILALLSFIHFS